MEKIASFTVNHELLKEGLYVSRVDTLGMCTVTTFDIRMKKPNCGDYLSTAAAHTLEHLGASFLRSHEDTKNVTVYFGPMGCRTGFYVVFFGELEVDDVREPLTEMFEFIAAYEGLVPGASARECGNYRDLELSEAKLEAEKYLSVLRNLNEENTVYPQ